MKNIKLTIEYDGSSFAGWQRQQNALSVQQALEEAISSITRESVTLTGSSRTDAGVHARGQVANFYSNTSIPVDKLPSAINSKLRRDAAVLLAEEVPEDFHARYCSKGKRYSYIILNRKVPPALMRNYFSHCPYELDFELMRESAAAIIGKHDFSAFRSTGSSVKTSVRTVKLLELFREGDIITMYIEADGFLYNMVRIIAGTFIDIGRGRIAGNTVGDIIVSRDRNKAGHTAPASGLCLEKVYY